MVRRTRPGISRFGVRSFCSRPGMTMHNQMRLPFFYGWIIAVVTFVTMAIGVNARTAFSLFFPPILDEFGWERGVTAGAFSFGFLVSAAQPADRAPDGSFRSARGDGAWRCADGGRPAAGATDEPAVASLPIDRRLSWLGDRTLLALP